MPMLNEGHRGLQPQGGHRCLMPGARDPLVGSIVSILPTENQSCRGRPLPRGRGPVTPGGYQNLSAPRLLGRPLAVYLTLQHQIQISQCTPLLLNTTPCSLLMPKKRRVLKCAFFPLKTLAILLPNFSGTATNTKSQLEGPPTSHH